MNEKYKQLYGRNPRKDWDDDKILEKILEKEPDYQVDLELANDALQEKEEEEVKAEVVKEEGKQPVSMGVGFTKQYRVILPDGDRYWTKNVINQALKTEPFASTIQFPEDTDFVAEAKLSKCKSC